ncbi:4'-phosphopantetheinyl transferase superfamily protein [Nicoliella spurrieriana]|uniref:4'-phosphopantetheinyl transferase superfamily protein n=1 Tax=Nicoliella spurrieriana TaxID=2925830 RepID=A0A976X6H6_9LACO|nr:4'-phosphopantetheinyl transferase superfamily protein [Nicoliella spurrieriana]UQS87434.1 4'-phosphopantetheinyl transferase superfamily protein [Nicoliella spurrieriana]
MVTLRIDSIQNPRYQATFERYKLGKKYNPRQSIVGTYLLADWLAETPAVIASGRLFDHGPHGKPRLKSGAPQYNLANSYDKVVLAVADQPIGVDLEKIRPYDYHRIHRAFRPEELDYLAGLSGAEQVRATFKIWTIKEAVLKLVGMGIPGGIRSMQIDLKTFAHANRYGQSIRLSPLYVGMDYVGTIAQFEE